MIKIFSFFVIHTYNYNVHMSFFSSFIHFGNAKEKLFLWQKCFLVTGKLGRMAGIGTGRGPLYMDIPVEPRDALQNIILYILGS